MAGNFIWYELMTPDQDAAQTFYGSVLGYTVIPSQNPNMDYRMWQLGDVVLGGLMKLPDEAAANNMPPCWLAYVHVPDVDATVAAITADGGKVCMPAVTMEGAGRMALVCDPQGAGFYVMTPSGEGVSTSAGNGLGQCGWNELHTSDGDAAKDFYVKHCGWTLDEPMDMGPMGKYHLFSIDGVQSGGMMTDANFPNPAWLYYLTVDDIDAAAARVTAGGGAILFGPSEVPGGAWILNGQDPQGAMFSLTGPRK